MPVNLSLLKGRELNNPKNQKNMEKKDLTNLDSEVRKYLDHMAEFILLLKENVKRLEKRVEELESCKAPNSRIQQRDGTSGERMFVSKENPHMRLVMK
nr:MAG TPA: zipper dimerization domain transcription factor-like protein [Caudoviricetes sp.]